MERFRSIVLNLRQRKSKPISISILLCFGVMDWATMLLIF